MGEHIEHTETDAETGLTLKIIQDPDCDQPYDGDEAVILAVLHGRYINPAAKRTEGDFTTVEGIQAFFDENNREDPDWIVIPLFLYDHSGTVYRAHFDGNPFACPWDSGRVGIVALKRTEFGEPADYGAAKEHWLKLANDVCTEYTRWANGECFGYVVEDAEGEEVPDGSCWAFIGYDYALEQGRAALAGAVKATRARIAQALEEDRPDLYAGA